MKYDLIIIGAGPAGLTAALYAARYNMKILVIGKILGGTIGEASKVCNFPSYENITGMELVKKMVKQIENLKVEIKPEEVLNVNKIKEGTKKSKIFGATKSGTQDFVGLKEKLEEDEKI